MRLFAARPEAFYLRRLLTHKTETCQEKVRHFHVEKKKFSILLVELPNCLFQRNDPETKDKNQKENSH